MAPPRLTMGAIRFAECVLALPRPKQATAAKRLGVGQQTISKIMLGRFVPASYVLVEVIRVEFGIEPALWGVLTRFTAPAPAHRQARKRRRARRAA